MPNELWDMLTCEHGSVALVAREDRLVRVCFEASAEDATAAVRRLYPEAGHASNSCITRGLDQLAEFFLGKRREFTVLLAVNDLSEFIRSVQRELLKVPYGDVVTYCELATRAGSPRAARAVGRVMSSNPFPLLVPCHRVVNADGTIGQYSGARGSVTKAWLIDFERGVVTSRSCHKADVC